ncbi:MAG: 5-(carboxyamino)imidazole ribonucleotide mutase [Spirochaetaceae bacterium]|nr:5-(carboxyamino)imidazole ribonucleotide mutase [Spirochaetaceae bacterium]
MKAAIIFGSPSDRVVMQKAADVLRSFDIAFSSHVVSAHRAPELLEEVLAELEGDGTEVIIAGAGLAAHLPGVIAGRTLVPVIGVPIAAGTLGGMDALFSIVQMPKPVPVAAVGVDNGANAAYLAAEILSLKYPGLKKKLADFRTTTKMNSKQESRIDL